jgi:trans-aconitate methyltransferase
MESYVPDREYDVILFRESVYYAKDVPNMLNRLWLSLEPNGVFIVRICNRDRHAEVINQITRNWRVKKTVLLDTNGIILVFS